MSGALTISEPRVAQAAPTARASRGRFQITSPRATMAKLSAYGVLVLVGLFFITPLLWLVLAAFEPEAAVGASTPLVLSFSNFGKVLNWSGTFLPLINSAIQSGGTAVLTVVASLFAAYPLSRYHMRFRRPFLYTIVFSTGLPITAILVPVYSMFARFDLVDNVPAVILFMTATSLPFGIWLMKGFMDGVPIDLEQAAWVDGATWVQSLRRVVAPLMMPGIAVILLQSTSKLPASVAIYQFFSQYGQTDYGQLAAFSILYTLPVVMLWIVMSRFLRGNFTFAGAVKG